MRRDPSDSAKLETIPVVGPASAGDSYGYLHTIDILESCASDIFSPNDSGKRDTVELLKLVIRKKVPSDLVCGIVIAGFGSNEMFTKLISYEIDGFVCNRLKYSEINKIYIERDGVMARVISVCAKTDGR